MTEREEIAEIHKIITGLLDRTMASIQRRSKNGESFQNLAIVDLGLFHLLCLTRAGLADVATTVREANDGRTSAGGD